MATATSTKTYWVYFFVSLLVTIGFLVVWPEWFWVPLPFLFTSLVKAFDWL
ncbi:MAG: hypothetical protein ACJATI_000157 [Halioglobus sp.]|jgi:hypothetical protein